MKNRRAKNNGGQPRDQKIDNEKHQDIVRRTNALYSFTDSREYIAIYELNGARNAGAATATGYDDV